MSLFSFTKLENKRAEQVLLVCVEGLVSVGGGKRWVGKGHGRVNIVQILCPHVCK
jgi:hypothetical protein